MGILRIIRENQEILRKRYYKYGNERIDLSLNTGIYDFESVEVYTPEHIKNILDDSDHYMKEHFYEPLNHEIEVRQADSYEIAKNFYRPLILNTANALYPGGKDPATSDTEEVKLCHCTSLYQSLSSQQASQVYLFHQNCKSYMYSDYMILSPCVAVFRDENYELIKHPYPISVLSVTPANANGKKNNNVYQSELEGVMKERMQKFLMVAARNMYRNLILTPFGCEEYGYSYEKIAQFFYEILVEENYIEYFEHIIFAISKEQSRCYEVFYNCFSLNHNEIACKTAEVIPSLSAMMTDSYVENVKYITTTYPFPVCNYEVKEKDKITHIGFTQGILEDGIPFTGELFRGIYRNDISVVFVLPYFESLNRLQFSNDSSRFNLKKGNKIQKIEDWHSVLCAGMRLAREELEYNDLIWYIRYLIYMNLIDIQKTDIEGFAHVLYDRAGQKVVAIELSLIKYNQVDVLVPLQFQSYETQMIEDNKSKDH